MACRNPQKAERIRIDRESEGKGEGVKSLILTFHWNPTDAPLPARGAADVHQKQGVIYNDLKLLFFLIAVYSLDRGII
jgi:hypothetical protein